MQSRTTQVRVLPPPGLEGDEVVLAAQYAYSAGETRVFDLRDVRGRVVVDLPVGTRFQFPRSTRIRGKLLVDDHVRIHRVEVL